MPIDPLEQANQLFNTFSNQVTAGLLGNTEKLYEAAQELRNQEGNTEDLSARTSQCEAHNQDLEAQDREYDLKLLP